MEASAARGAGLPPAPAPLPGRLLKLASDDRLVEHVRGGSQPAFEAVFDRHHRGILSFCRHMLNDAGEAEDAVQHTFMAAYRDLVGSDKPIQLKPWLYTIARNRCLSVLRARREQPSEDIDRPSLENLSEEVQRRADLQDMLKDVAELPEDQRAALVLSEIGDVSHEQIAQVLGCPREKVKALMFQARSSLVASRQARDTSCQEIREQLAVLSGGSLRRNQLRRHLRDCEGCRAFADEVKHQRKALGALLPVVPTLGLKESALAAAFGSGGAGAAATAAAGGAAVAGAATAGAGGVGALAAKALVVVAVAGGGGAATVATLGDDGPAGPPAKTERPNPGPGNPPALPAAAAGGQETSERARSGEGPVRRRVRKRPNRDAGTAPPGRRPAKGQTKQGKAEGKAVGRDRSQKATRRAEQDSKRAAARERRNVRQRPVRPTPQQAKPGPKPQTPPEQPHRREEAPPEQPPEAQPSPRPEKTPRGDGGLVLPG